MSQQSWCWECPTRAKLHWSRDRVSGTIREIGKTGQNAIINSPIRDLEAVAEMILGKLHMIAKGPEGFCEVRADDASHTGT